MPVLEGTAFWASVKTPNTTYEPTYSVNLVVADEVAEDFKERGYLSAPIIQAGDSTWTGFRLDKIKSLANKLFGENK